MAATFQQASFVTSTSTSIATLKDMTGFPKPHRLLYHERGTNTTSWYFWGSPGVFDIFLFSLSFQIAFCIQDIYYTVIYYTNIFIYRALARACESRSCLLSAFMRNLVLPAKKSWLSLVLPAKKSPFSLGLPAKSFSATREKKLAIFSATREKI